ncbi:MAG: UDP-3-O-(3-hydroxymyristoyl)glucosamine N-acyltransferase [Verrucomicrobiae bacterium]|nr:UDP-3-O-(3-hydroxymyristoyl)glucosamine N-acyltransferase [Verrucomicrobiae bacterium]
MTDIVTKLVESFHKHGGINHLDGANLPSRDAVVEITRDLLRLVFPGFYDKDPIHSNQVGEFTQELVASVVRRLENEIHRSLEYRPCDACDKHDLPGTAARVTREFLAELPAVRATLQTDVTAAYEGDPAAISNEEIILAYPGIEAIAVQRMAHVLYQRHVALIPRIMTEWAHNKTGIDIHPGAQIGSHFFIDHGTGVVIGETSVIGRRVKIYQGVTLGAKSFPKDEQGRAVKGIKRHPNIEDDVTIYAGATILGNVTIGQGTIIGGNVWLLESVPSQNVVYSEGGQTKMKSTAKERDKMIGHSDGSGI